MGVAADECETGSASWALSAQDSLRRAERACELVGEELDGDPPSWC